MMRVLLSVLLLSSVSAFVPRTSRLPRVARGSAAYVSASAPAVAAQPVVKLIDTTEDDDEMVMLRDPVTSRCIECYVNTFASVEGEDSLFALAMPVDPCVEICSLDEKTDELTTVDVSDPLMDKLFGVSRAALKLHALCTAVVPYKCLPSCVPLLGGCEASVGRRGCARTQRHIAHGQEKQR